MYYNVKVKLSYEDDKGRVKSKTEAYLVKAESVTDAEVIVNEEFKSYPNEFEVKSVTQSNVIDVLAATN
jgi:hypothetical protein